MQMVTIRAIQTRSLSISSEYQVASLLSEISKLYFRFYDVLISLQRSSLNSRKPIRDPIRNHQKRFFCKFVFQMIKFCAFSLCLFLTLAPYSKADKAVTQYDKNLAEVKKLEQISKYNLEDYVEYKDARDRLVEGNKNIILGRKLKEEAILIEKQIAVNKERFA